MEQTLKPIYKAVLNGDKDAATENVQTALDTGTDAGGILKEVGTEHWNTPNTGATNSIGFTALPHGYKSSSPLMAGHRTFGYWWTSSETLSSHAWLVGAYHNNTQISHSE